MKKKLIIIGIIVIGIAVLGFIIPPPNGFWGGGEIASESTTIIPETLLVEPLASPPPTQIEDEFPELENQNAPQGYLYAQNLYANLDKSNTGWKRDDDGTTNLYQQTTKNLGTGNWITDLVGGYTYRAEIEDTTLEDRKSVV